MTTLSYFGLSQFTHVRSFYALCPESKLSKQFARRLKCQAPGGEVVVRAEVRVMRHHETIRKCSEYCSNVTEPQPRCIFGESFDGVPDPKCADFHRNIPSLVPPALHYDDNNLVESTLNQSCAGAYHMENATGSVSMGPNIEEYCCSTVLVPPSTHLC